MNWLNLEHYLHRRLIEEVGEERLKGARFLIAVSGGMDSLVLLNALQRISTSLKIKVGVAHIHHGGEVFFRDRAYDFVKNLCNVKEISFYSQRAQVMIENDENSLREFRQQALQDLKRETQSDYLVYAHHADDLLETRILRLIRGTGFVGLESMSFVSNFILRPLIEVTRKEMLDYAQECQLEWVEDPSNQETHYFRNWLRLKWLPELESFYPGSLVSLARSLENIDAQYSQLPTDIWNQEGNICLPVYWTLSRPQQRQALAILLYKQGKKDYSRGLIEEIQKHLDNSPKIHTFSIGKYHFECNTMQLKSRISE